MYSPADSQDCAAKHFGVRAGRQHVLWQLQLKNFTEGKEPYFAVSVWETRADIKFLAERF